MRTDTLNNRGNGIRYSILNLMLPFHSQFGHLRRHEFVARSEYT
jgi:hypothetical protein